MSGSGAGRNYTTKLMLKSSQREKSKAACIPVKHWQKPIKAGIATAMDGLCAALGTVQPRFHFHLASLSLDFSGGTKRIGFLTKQTYQDPLSSVPVTGKLVFDVRVAISRHSRKEAQHVSVPS